MSVNTYKKTDHSQLTANFSISEFHCQGTACGCTETLHDPLLSQYLQQIRQHFGKAVRITSGYRCQKHNTAVGGASGSRHTTGQAADFCIPGVAPLKIAQYAESIGVKGIGLYEDFVHIDTRTEKSFWYGHQQEHRDTFCPQISSHTLYIVTCQVNSAARYTLLFDAAAGAVTQRLGNSAAAVAMTLANGKAQFDTVNIGADQAQILLVTELTL